MNSMRAVAVETFKADPRCMDLPRPEISRTEILVKINAAAINPVDWKLADGLYSDSGNFVLPFILGVDAIGTVTEVGAGVSAFNVGDRIFGEYFSSPMGKGTYAEYIALPGTVQWAGAPAALSDEIAAALPTPGLTALGMVDMLELAPGSKVLIVGATGAVGSLAVQFAAARGFTVLATSATSEAARMQELGAFEIFDRHEGDLEGQITEAHGQGIDGLIDTTSDARAFERLSKLVVKGGWAVSAAHAADPKLLAQRSVRGVNFVVKGNSFALRRLAGLAAAHKLKVDIRQTIGLGDAPAAIAAAKAGRVRGKTVLKIS